MLLPFSSTILKVISAEGGVNSTALIAKAGSSPSVTI